MIYSAETINTYILYIMLILQYNRDDNKEISNVSFNIYYKNIAGNFMIIKDLKKEVGIDFIQCHRSKETSQETKQLHERTLTV